MAKRFTGTDKWGKRFFRALKPQYKLLWLLILDECDTAGIWEVDLQVAEIKIGAKISEKDALKSFADKIAVIDGGSKWFVRSFIEFQYGELNEANRAHTKAIFLLKKFGLLSDDLKIKPLSKDLTSPLQVAMDMDMEEGMEGDKEEGMDKGGRTKKENVLVMPFGSDEFNQAWQHWRTYKAEQHKFSYKSTTTEQAALTELTKLAKGVEQMAVAIILQSIGHGWKGFFELKKNSNGANGITNNTKQTGTDLTNLAARLAATLPGNNSQS